MRDPTVTNEADTKTPVLEHTMMSHFYESFYEISGRPFVNLVLGFVAGSGCKLNMPEHGVSIWRIQYFKARINYSHDTPLNPAGSDVSYYYASSAYISQFVHNEINFLALGHCFHSNPSFLAERSHSR